MKRATLYLLIVLILHPLQLTAEEGINRSMLEAFAQRAKAARTLTFEYDVHVQVTCKEYQFSRKTTVAVTRNPELTVVQGDWPVYNTTRKEPDMIKQTLVFGNDFVGSMWYDVEGNPYTFMVSRTTTNAAHRYNPWGHAYLNDAESLIFLGGETPFGLYDLVWRVERATAQELRLYAIPTEEQRQKWQIGRSEYRYELILDTSLKAPKLLIRYPDYGAADMDVYHTSYRASEYRLSYGYYFPQRVVMEHRLHDYRLRAEFYLRRVEVSKKIDLNDFIPLGTWIADYRHRIVDHKQPTVPAGVKAVQYRWQGRLLSLAELEQLAQDAPPTRPRPWGLWVSFIAAIALLLTGVVWYARTRKHA